MSTRPWTPFSDARREALRVALARGARSLDELRALRGEVSAGECHLTALARLTDQEPGLASRLWGRMVPAALRHAQALVARPLTLALHVAGRPAETTLTRAEAAGLVGMMFLGALPQPSTWWPRLDFAQLLDAHRAHELAKLRCVLEYFDRVAVAAPRGRITVARVVVPARTSMEWALEGAALTPFAVDAAGLIEDAHGHRQVDFANRFLGGGVLTGGCVQEEIRFAVAPEHLAVMAVSPPMEPEEAIVMRGAERFAATRGYARALTFAGPFHDPVPREADGSADVEFVAIDAVDYRRADAGAQYTETSMLRELAKARAGFARDARGEPVATGNWGCGAFRGDPELKAVLQWIAASAEGRAVRYFTFGDPRVGGLEAFVTAARARFATAGALWARLRAVAPATGPDDLFARLLA